MRRTLVLATLAAALAAGGCGGAEEAGPQKEAERAASPPRDAHLAVFTGSAGSELMLVDGRTLRPLDKALPLPFYHSVARRSPDRSTVALGGNERAEIQLVDLGRMRALQRVELPLTGWVAALHWPAPDRLLAVVDRPASVALVDPVAGRTLLTRELDGAILHAVPAGDGLALLLAPGDGIGPARLAVFDGRRVRTTTLGEIAAGWRSEGADEDYRSWTRVPALAVDPTGRRALVVPAGRRVAEVDLETLAVRYHDLSEPVSLLGRLRDWLEPAAAAKRIDGPERHAVWLAGGLVAVSGADYEDSGAEIEVTPAGVAIVDTADWSVRRADGAATWVNAAGDGFFSVAWPTEGGSRAEVAVHGPDGAERFRFTRSGADPSYAAGGYIYVALRDGTRYEIVDLRTGAVVARARPPRSIWLVDAD